MLRKRKLKKSLPAVRVDENIWVQVRQIADHEQVAMADVLRSAIENFLTDYNTKCIVRDKFTILKETTNELQ